MYNKIMNKLIDLILNSINETGEKEKIDESTYSIFKFHSLSHLLYNVKSNETDKDVSAKINESYFKAINRDTIQLKEYEKIEKLFEENGIDAIFLKGCVMKYIYKETFYRSMTDIDCLVRKEHFRKAKKLIKNMGYTVDSNSEHHIEFQKKPIMVFELHRMLIPKVEYGKNIFDGLFERSKLKNGMKHIYQMSDEDFYLFMMCHLLKHYYIAGTGIRSFLDVYVYLKNKPNLDFEYINNKLKTLEYYSEFEFLKNFSLDVFDGNELNEKEKEVLKYIIESGTYGLHSNVIKKDLEESKGSVFRVVFRKLFPKYSTLIHIYPSLKKVPFLLPLYYIRRHIYFIMHLKRSIGRRNDYKEYKEEHRI